MRPKILLVEDDLSLVELVRYNLDREGFDVLYATDGEEGIEVAREQSPDLVLLDWMLPLVSGIEVCRRLRKLPETSNIPIIMLTARGEETDRIRGLDSGADDYVSKPYSPRELISRINAVLRRVRPLYSGKELKYADVVLDATAHKVMRSGRRIRLGPTEFRLLRHFMESPDRVFSREQLLDSVWGQDVYVEPRTVDVHIRRLRSVLNAGDQKDLIRTVRSAGYSLDEGGA